MPKNDGKLSKVWNADLGGRQHDVGLPVMCPAVPVLQLATGGRGGPKSPR
jgi:hypothetical protein